MTEIFAIRENIAESGKTIARRDQQSNCAIAQDVFDLGRLEYRIDRYEYTASCRCSEHRDDRFELLRKVDADAFLLVQAESDRRGGERLDRLLQRAVGVLGISILECWRRCRAGGRESGQLIQQTGHAIEPFTGK